MSPEFILKYIEWSKSRVVLLSPTRKRDRGWYETLPSIWSQWILEGVVENETYILSTIESLCNDTSH